METNSPKELVPKFFDETADSYDKIAEYCTFGKDKYWKDEILKQTDGKSFLDLACGTGILTRRIAQNYPDSRVVGVDITASYLELAKKNSQGYDNISYILQDAESLALDSKFDCITSSYIPKYCNPKKLVKKCISHLNDGGKIILHDFTYPKSKSVRFAWNSFFVMLNFVGLFIPSWKKAFAELPNLIRTSNWVQSYTDEMKKSGLHVDCQYYTRGCVVILTGTRQ